MSQRQLISNIMNREPAERCGFWLGNPLPETIQVYNQKLGTSSLEEIQHFLGKSITTYTMYDLAPDSDGVISE